MEKNISDFIKYLIRLWEDEKDKFIIAVMGIVMIGIISITVIFYQNQINHKIEPKIMHPTIIGMDETKETTTVRLASNYLFVNEKLSNKDTLISFGTNLLSKMYKPMRIINQYLELLDDFTKFEYIKKADIEEIVIPTGAGYVGTEGLKDDEEMLDDMCEYLDIDKHWFRFNTHIYMWVRECELNNGKKRIDSNYVFIYNKNFVYASILSVENRKIVMKLYGGEIEEQME